MSVRLPSMILISLVGATGCFNPAPNLSDESADESSSGTAPGDASSSTDADPPSDDGGTTGPGSPDEGDTVESSGSTGSPTEESSETQAPPSESSSDGPSETDDPGSEGEPVVLFDGGVEVLGDWGPRANADAHCDAHPNKPEGMQAVAFASFGLDSEIQDLPTMGFDASVEVRGPSGTISTSWTALLDGNIEASLHDAGVLPLDAYWLSGSNPNGTIDTFGACSGFTITEQNANAGFSEATDDAWMHHHGGGCWESTTAYHRLCIAFR